jgi:4-carboxymuconolactone decarboxylase
MKKYNREKGLEKFDEVYCGDLSPLPEAGKSQFLDYMLETLFATLWADETFSIRERRLMLIGAIAAQGDEGTLTIQLRSALKRGELSREQLQHLPVFLTQYVGYPLGSRLFGIVGKLLQEPIAAPKKK